MKPFRPKSFNKTPYFTPSQIDSMCCDELRSVGLMPDSPEPIRIDRFIEKRFYVSPQYEDMPDGVLGFTRFGKNGVKAVTYPDAGHGSLFQWHDSFTRQTAAFLASDSPYAPY